MKASYWILTALFCLVNLVGGASDLLWMDVPTEVVTNLGYPSYLLTILGVWRIAGAVVLLLPGFSEMKTWVYAGFFFLFSGAFVSHIAVGQSFWDAAPALILWLLMMGSYLLRSYRLD